MGEGRSAVEPSTLETLLREASPDGMLVVDPDGAVLVTNARFADVWGLTADVVAAGGRAIHEAVTGLVADPEAFDAQVRAHAGATGPARTEVVLADGRILECHGAPLVDASGAVLAGAWFVRDVTDRHRAHDRLRDLASALQASLLPPREPSIPGMDVAARFRPADRRVEVGGDFYDVFRLRTNEWGVVVGDVCGSGAPAASLAALARHTTRAAAVHSTLPTGVLRELNDAVLREPETDDRFCSAVFATVELDLCGAWVTLASAGHPRPMLVRAAGWIDLRGQPGSLLGLFDDPVLADDRVGLGPGDCLVICTDGITEARSPSGAMFDDAGRLAEVLVACATVDCTADDIADRVVEAAITWTDGALDDDAAIVVLRVPLDAKADPEGRLASATGASPAALPLPAYQIGDERRDLVDRPAPPREARILLPADPGNVDRAIAFVGSVVRSWRLGDDVAATTAAAVPALVDPSRSQTLVARYGGADVSLEIV
jgi:PAS domain S-box-containing protein